MIKVQCNGCKKTVNVPDQYAGRSVACPGCKTPLVVPAVPPASTATAPTEPYQTVSQPAATARVVKKKKTRFILIALILVIVAGGLAWQILSRNAAKAEKKTQLAERTPPPESLDSFRGVSWGEELTNNPEFKLIKEDKTFRTATYTRDNEKMTVGKEKLLSVEYETFEGKFYKGMIVFESEATGYGIATILEEKYRKPRYTPEDQLESTRKAIGDGWSWYGANSSGKDVIVYLNNPVYNRDKAKFLPGSCNVNIEVTLIETNDKLTKLREASEKQKAKDAAGGL